MKLDRLFWNRRYLEGNTGWDAGSITTPLREYFDQLQDRNLKILIPGSGNGYEAEYLFNHGFRNTFVIDISDIALQNLKRRIPEFPDSQLLNEDFFDTSGSYDLIIEQTFFCALDPKLRKDYARKMFDLLTPGGKLVGLLFDDPLYEDHPPYGGNASEYEEYFNPYFAKEVFEGCRNSIKPRAGRELFIILRKDQNSST